MSVRASVAVWFCKGCTAKQRPASYPCRECCGYTGKRAKVMADVLDAWGRPSRRVPS